MEVMRSKIKLSSRWKYLDALFNFSGESEAESAEWGPDVVHWVSEERWRVKGVCDECGGSD